MVQKSGYFSRSAAANDRDLELIKSMTDFAVDSALRGEPGVIGHDEERGDELRAIEFERIKGGKPFDITAGLVRRTAERHRPTRADRRRAALDLATADRLRDQPGQGGAQPDPGCRAGDVTGTEPDLHGSRGDRLRHHDRLSVIGA